MNSRKNWVLIFCLTFLTLADMSCQKEDGASKTEIGTVTGYVRDVLDNPVKDVTVGISGVNETVLTDERGFYAIENIPIADAKVSFVSKKYECERNLPRTLFTRGIAYVDVVFEAKGMISGIVYNSESDTGGTPVAGVTVSLDDDARTTVTDVDGKYLFADVEIKNYKLIFSAKGSSSVLAKVSASMFRNSEVCANVDKVLYKGRLLPGLTASDLKNCDVWYYNEYRGGRGGAVESIDSPYNSYMSLLDLRGSWQNQNEGVTLRVEANLESENLDDFQSFVFGRKAISEENKILTLNARTHGAEASSPVVYGVQVIDIHADEPILEYVGDRNREMNNNTSSYSDVVFDLSPYVGKEIVVAIGIYRNAAAVRQFVVRKISFAPKASVGTDYVANAGSGDIPGLDGWNLSAEMLRSAMVNENKSMTGRPGTLTENEIKTSNNGFKSWRGIGHLLESWAFQRIAADPQPWVNEGFLLKCRGNAPINTLVPESYIYSKYAISQGENKFRFNIGALFTKYQAPVYVKLTAVSEDGAYKHIDCLQSESTCTVSKAADGLSKVSTKGMLVYDLSEFNGQHVLVIFGIYQGEYDSSKEEQHRFALASIAIN